MALAGSRLIAGRSRDLSRLAAPSVAAVIAVALFVGGCFGGGGSDQAPATPEAPGGDVHALQAAPCPDAIGVADRAPSDVALARARAGRFRIYRDAVLRLSPPIDWQQDPLNALRFRDTFPKLRFLDPLLWAYDHDGDTGALRQALAIVLDWARSNPLGGPDTAPAAWIDKVTGDRAPYVSYVARAAACQGMLSRADAKLLLTSIAEHERVLLATATKDRTNHGLFVDLGLAVLADYFPFLHDSDEWASEARKQFLKTLRGRLADGVWLEHSTAYQFLAIRAVERFVAYTGDTAAGRILRRMKRSAGWFVEPDDKMTLFGDTYLFPVPPWGLRIAHGLEGMKVFPKAGFAFVRAPGPGDAGEGYLAVASDFHNTTHKHADDLSFELYDRGHRIISDTGLYDKDPGPPRDFVLSARAHSVLTVDGQGFPILDPSKAYGSGIVATGQGDGWYAIEGTNPLVRDQGVSHHRLFLYRPGVALVVVDRLRAAATHEYTRHFQLGPSVAIHDEGPSAIDLRASGLRGRLYDAPTPGPARRSEVRGSHHPLAGLVSPQFRVFHPRWTVDLTTHARDATYAATFALDASRLRARVVGAKPGGTTLAMRERTGPRVRLEVKRSGDSLSVTGR